MATILPPVVRSPVNRHFQHRPSAFDGLSEPYPIIDNVPATPLASAVSINPRQTSTSSILSVASAPLHPRKNENRGAYDIPLTPSRERSISLHKPKKYARCSLRPSRKLRRSQILRPCHNLGFTPRGLPRASQLQDTDEPWREKPQDAKGSTNVYLSGNLDRRPRSLTAFSVTENTSRATADEGSFESSHEFDKDDGKFRHWVNTFRRRKNVPLRTPILQSHYGQTLSILDQDPPYRAHSSPTFLVGLHRRLSNSSSGFVETVKTASFSNPSISMGPRSHRLTRSAETRGNRSSNVRYSIDSDRPLSRPSLDEGALCRGLRRRQILREILMSEESYLVDLRALNNLFSTLLTSVASLSTLAKANIQRNLIEILHLHTELANELYRVSTVDVSTNRMAHRMFRKSGAHSHINGSSLESHLIHERDPQNRHSRYSIDSLDSNALLRTAEPSEAADLARAFRHFMPRFLVYEEYCSNHEIMLRELVASQRLISSWPLYETGIEALTRSIRAINHRRGSNKRAMTVGDLLMSPIQRLTKYPLLFVDLHISTPVMDCPDSHAELDLTVLHLRELVREVNHVTDDHIARERIRKRWLLQDRLAFSDETLRASQFRMLGHPVLCGVLHLAYQTKVQVRGAYGLCILFETHTILAVPARQAEKFDVVAVIDLSDLRIESTSDGTGNDNRIIFSSH
jgi:hypothetical protein